MRFAIERLAAALSTCVLIAGCLAASPLMAEPAPAAKPVEAEANKIDLAAQREAWRKDMAKRPLPKTSGCFTADFPAREWKETHCGKASPHPNRPTKRTTGPGANTVGNGSDWVAQSSGSIASVTGSFLGGPLLIPSSANGVSGEPACEQFAGCPASLSNVFMLQINTQSQFYNQGSATFTTSACNGHAGCFGWQQFLFSQTQGPPPGPGQQSAAPTAPVGNTPGIFIEYWLYNYGATCPALPSWALGGQPAGTPWTSDGGGDCWFNGPMTYVPPQTAASLPGLIMTATASATQDTVKLTAGGTTYVYAQPSVLHLYGVWTRAEFNVFGDCCGTVVSFAHPSVLFVQTAVDDGTANAPTCGANEGTTGETNSLIFIPSPSGVCCPFGGASPSISFMEADDTTHQAWCAAARIEGDPHITIADGSANGVKYDFQGAGEFVALREPDGTEVQTRHTPVTTAAYATDPHDGLSNSVSLITAMAARVGGHRVTWEPNLNGVPDPGGLQLRVDGKLTTLGGGGMGLGDGARLAMASGALKIDFPDGKILLATPEFWNAEGKWYLNIDISNVGLATNAGAGSATGIMARIPAGGWLPVLPTGASMGPMPASLTSRFDALYRTFADAWRVTGQTTLFDYAPHTSTATFTQANWPILRAATTPLVTTPAAAAACKGLTDEGRRADCIFDLQVTGNVDFAKTYLSTERILTALHPVKLER